MRYLPSAGVRLRMVRGPTWALLFVRVSWKEVLLLILFVTASVSFANVKNSI